MAEYKTNKQVNYGFPLTFNASGKFPIIAKRIWSTYAEALGWVNDVNEAAVAGLQLSVINDEDPKKNGVYFVAKIGTGSNDGELVKVGDGSGSEAVANYAAAVAAATSDNLGQILYVINPTYKKGEGTTLNSDEADVDEEGNKIVVYTAGPYIVTGSGAVAKLGTTSATGDIAGDVENLKGRMSTAEGEIDALQAAVGDASKGLVADVDGIKTTIGDATSGLVADVAANVKAIEANAEAVVELRNAVQGGVHFAGVIPSNNLPSLTTTDVDDAYAGTWVDLEGESHSRTFHLGDIIILTKTGASDEPAEPTAEYILAKEFDEPKWVELGNVAPADQKIAELEKDFDDHVAGVAKMLEPYALVANVVANETFNQHVSDASGRMDGIDGRLNGIDEAILAVPVKSVTKGDVLKLSEEGALSVDMSNFVTKDEDKVLSTNDFTDDLKAKLDGVAAGAQVNVIETIKVNGGVITVAEDKSVNIDMVNHLAAKLSVNGNVLTESNGVLTAVVDAADINLGSDIGSHTAANTTVQDMLKNVYDIANTKIGTLHIASGASANVLALSKTDIANDTIELKIASGSAITATANGLDLVWTEL